MVENRHFFHTAPAFDAQIKGSLSEYCHNVWNKKLQWCLYTRWRKKLENVFTRFDTIHEHDGYPRSHRTTA